MEFDQSLMKQAAAFQAMSETAQQATSPSQAENGQHSSTLRLTQPSHASHMPLQRSSSRTGHHRHTVPAAPQLSNGLPQSVSGAASSPLRMTRGHKRARSPSSEQPNHPQPSPRAQCSPGVQPAALSPQEVSHRIQIQKQALPQSCWPQHAQQQPQQLQQVRQQARLQQQLQHAQQLQHQQLQQQQQHQQQDTPDSLPLGAVPIGLHQAGFQPLHASLPPQEPAVTARTAPTLPHQTQLASPWRQQQQKQQPEKQAQKSPKQLPMRPMPTQQRASQPEQAKAKSPGAVPDSVDGMSKEEIIAAAAAAAAASGYCEPKGLASLVGRSVQVCMAI